ncbi:hypothetical protein VE00_07883 [Pseudogymnoascus sp. WSF 3629]|nr:hypothetical protein VE00_07883 [Pseudogymnoascus sp. WSF 3629]
MATSTQTFSMVTSFPTGEENMIDAQFVEWCNDQLFTPEYSSADFEDPMLHDGTVPWGCDWTDMDWHHCGDTPNRTDPREEFNDVLPVFINQSKEPAEDIATVSGQDGKGVSVITGSEQTESTDEPKSTGEPESPEKPESQEGSRSPEESQSPEEPVEETAPGLVQDEESIAREEYKTENLLYLRTKLHKGLLTKKGRKECQMSDMSSLLRRLELHFEQLECISYEERLEYISCEDVRAAKASVLLRAINRQEGIPFEFKGRAASLLAKWGCIRRRRVKPVVKSALQREAGPTAPLMAKPTESCESSTNPGTPSLQGSDDDENNGVAVNPAWNIVGIDLTESCKPVAISETPSSQAIVDCNQSSRSASLATNDDKSLIESVSAEENPTARDVPSSKGGKRKSPASECSASELESSVRRSKRLQISIREYVTAETKFVDEGPSEIDKIIGAINSGESPAIIIRKLKGLKSGFVAFGAFHDRADREWSS